MTPATRTKVVDAIADFMVAGFIVTGAVFALGLIRNSPRLAMTAYVLALISACAGGFGLGLEMRGKKRDAKK